MEKFSNLLDEMTILNFRLIWRLVGRYRSHLSIAIVSFIAFFAYFYYSQPIIYSLSIPVKTVAKHTVSNDLSGLVAVENTSSITLSELSVTLGSYSFIKSFSELILKEPNFDRLNFGAITNGKNLYGKAIRARCGNRNDCITEILVGALRGAFYLEQGMTENRYLLNVSALNNETVYTMAKVISKAIENNRIQLRQYLVVKELDSVTNLINESRGLLQKMDGFAHLEEYEKNQANISDLKEKIRTLQASINAEVSAISAHEARVIENRKDIEKASKVDQLNRLHTISAENKIDEIRLNIANLSNIPDKERSDSDNLVLSELKEELKKLEKKIPKRGSKLAYSVSDGNSKEQEGREKTIEFEYFVSKNKLARLEAEYEEAKVELDKINKDKISKDAYISKLKTDLEFLKNLESKQLSLKLMSSTMTSDLLFEDFSKDSREFRRSSLAKIFLFCLFISSFIYIISILFRYFVDDKIYSEDDLKTYFANLDFIGEVPSFE